MLPVSVAIRFPWWLLAAGGYFAWRFFYGQTGVMNAERKAAFAVAMRLTDPVKLERMAKAFATEGLRQEAAAIRDRAKLPNLSAAVQTQRAGIVKKALQSPNPDAVDAVADAFESQGATATADFLREYAEGLRNSSKVQPIVAAPPAPVPAPPPPAVPAQPESPNPEVPNIPDLSIPGFSNGG